MYKTLIRYEKLDLDSIAGGLSIFVSIFLGSIGIGVAIGLLSALISKHVPFRRSNYSDLEMSMALIFPYLSYFLAESVHLSGIVSILFCGFTMAHYTKRNLSSEVW